MAVCIDCQIDKNLQQHPLIAVNVCAILTGNYDAVAIFQTHRGTDGPDTLQKRAYLYGAEPGLVLLAVGIIHELGHHICQPYGLLLNGLQIARYLTADVVGSDLQPGKLSVAGNDS